MAAQTIGPETLAAALAARLIHDFSGPVSGVLTGLDLQAASDDPALKTSGLALAAESAQALLDLLEISRVSFGGLGVNQTAQAMRRLASGCFAGKRATLAWTPEHANFDAVSARTILLMCQVAVAGLGAGGVAELSLNRSGRGRRFHINGRGTRAALPTEVVEGLSAGETATGGMAGRGAPACYLHAITSSAGGQVTLESPPDGFSVTVTLPDV
jgi:hypothetical protein